MLLACKPSSFTLTDHQRRFATQPVGESGCGKTTLGRAILRLQKATSGQVLYRDQPLVGNMRPLRRHMQMIFQDPYASLNPRMSVRAILAEPIHALRIDGNGDVLARLQQLLSLVGLSAHSARRYPHEFSGGQRQRIGIARALPAIPISLLRMSPSRLSTSRFRRRS